MAANTEPLLVRRYRLRTKIIVWATVPTALILVIVAVATFHAYQQVTEDLVIERDQELTRLIANEVAREIGNYVEILRILRRSDIDRDSVARDLIEEQVADIIRPRIGVGGYAYLVDSTGTVLYHSDISRIGDNLSDHAAVQAVLEGRVGGLRTRDAQGRAFVASFSPVPGTDWGLVTEERWESLIRTSERYQQILLILLLMGIVLPSLVITIGVRRITRPVAALTSAAQQLAAGNFDQTITADTGDEIEELAYQFNRMANELQESYTDLESKVADRTKELAALNAIAASVNESLDLDHTLNRALAEMLQLLELEVGEIRLLDPKRSELVIRTQLGLSPEFAHSTDRRKLVETLPGRALLSGRPIICEDASENPSDTDARLDDLRAFVICPLQAKDKDLGTLSIGTRRGKRQFDRNERDLLGAVSDQIGVAIENARLFQVEQRRAEQLQAINEVGQRIASILSIDKLLDEIARLVQETLGYYMVSIGLLEDDEIVIKCGAGRFLEIQDPQPLRIKIGEQGIVGRVAQSGEAMLVSDVAQNAGYFHLPETIETRSELAVPLITKDTVIGVLDVQSDRLNAFDELDLTVLQTLGRQAAVAIENARLYEQAQQLAVIEERNRLARDLHDSVTQSLYGVTLFAEAAARLLTMGQLELAVEHLGDLRQTALEALQEMRCLIFELRPSILADHGLASALQARLEAVEERAGLEASFRVSGDDRRLAPETEAGLYRIAQETLNNTLKHAQARHVSVNLCQEPFRTVLEITDDGIGFDTAIAIQHGGLGLKGMAERAERLGARLQVCSRLGAGTQVRVEVRNE